MGRGRVLVSTLPFKLPFGHPRNVACNTPLSEIMLRNWWLRSVEVKRGRGGGGPNHKMRFVALALCFLLRGLLKPDLRPGLMATLPKTNTEPS